MLHLTLIAIKIGALLAAYGLIFSKLVKPEEAKWIRTKLVPIVVALLILGVLSPSVWIYWAIIFAIPPLLSRSTIEASCLYLVTVLASPSVAREMGVAGIYLLPFDKWLFAGLGLGLAVMIRRSRGSLPRGWFDLPFILCMFLELVQARGRNFTSTVRVMLGVSVAQIFPYVIISRSLRRPEDMKRIVLTIAFIGFVLSLEAFYESRFSFLPYELITQHLGTSLPISAYSKQRSGGLRASASFDESTSLGMFFAVALLAIWASRDSFRNKRSWVVALMGLVLGLYATNARSPLLALMLGMLAFDFYRKRIGAMFGKIAIGGMIVLCAFSAAQFSDRIAERMGLSGGSVDTSNYRSMLLHRGMEQIAKHPVLGVSVDQAYIELADLRQGEGIVDFVNGYVYYGMIAGVGGILALLVAFLGTAVRTYFLRRRLSRMAGMMPIAALVFSVGLFLTVTTFTTGFGGKGSMIVYVVMALGSALATRRRMRAPQPPYALPERPVTA